MASILLNTKLNIAAIQRRVFVISVAPSVLLSLLRFVSRFVSVPTAAGCSHEADPSSRYGGTHSAVLSLMLGHFGKP